MSGVATFPQGFERGVNPSTTKQRTWQDPRCSPPHGLMAPAPPPLPWAPGFTRACSQQRTPGLRLVLWRGHPQRMLRLAPTRPAAAPCFLQPPAHTSLLSWQLVPISLLSSRSVTLSPHLPSQLSPLVCPLSAFFALLFQPFPISCQPASGPQTSG